jgi:hypothetical protein
LGVEPLTELEARELDPLLRELPTALVPVELPPAFSPAPPEEQLQSQHVDAKTDAPQIATRSATLQLRRAPLVCLMG